VYQIQQNWYIMTKNLSYMKTSSFMANLRTSVAASLSDRELLERLLARQPDVLEQLYDSYGDMMYGVAFRILGNRQEAEDVTQDVFLNLWHHCNYDPNRASFKSFLMLLVRSRSLDRLRSHKSRLQTAERSGHLASSELFGRSPLESVASDEVSQRVQAALAELPPKQRQALELSYFGGLTQQEIAQQLEVPLGTVKSYFRLSFGKLRQSLHSLVS
jgi:RNA polymerase sigma-70 factor, ECF subfamily